jgi:hypothetical protein
MRRVSGLFCTRDSGMPHSIAISDTPCICHKRTVFGPFEFILSYLEEVKWNGVSGAYLSPEAELVRDRANGISGIFPENIEDFSKNPFLLISKKAPIGSFYRFEPIIHDFGGRTDFIDMDIFI